MLWAKSVGEGIGAVLIGRSVQMRVALSVLAVTLFLAELWLPRHGYGVPVLLSSCIGAALVVNAVRFHRPASALPWYLLSLSIVLAAGGLAVQSAMERSALDLPAASHVLMVSAMVIAIGAFGLFVRARTRVLDRYQILDLGIMVISASLAVSKLLLDPMMDANPPVGMSRALSTAYMLLMLVTLVLAVRFVTLPGSRGRAAWYLTGMTVGLLVGSLVTNATATADDGGLRASSTMMLAMIVAAMAARDRSMVAVTEPATGEPPSLGVVRLGGLGLALFLTPLTAVLVHARTDEIDGAALLVPGAVVTALVMARLRLLLTREEAARAEVEASRQAFSALIQGISDVITVVDARGAIAYATDSATRVLGRSADELPGQLLSALVHPDDAAMVDGVLSELAGSGRTVNVTVRLVVHGTERVFELEASDRMGSASLKGIVVVLHDVTDRHLLEGELRHQAFHDVLTGLPNRKLFSERVRAATQAGGGTSVLFVDLDDFKDVNDGLGHHAGDLLLCAVANRLSQACRTGDTVARLGGDEFAILVVDHLDDGTPQAVARRVLEVLERPFEVLGQRISVGASVGVATAAGHDEEELLRHADVAMYRAKAAGKGTMALFEPGMDDLATERLCLHVDLAEGIPRGDFELLYQPIFDLATGDLRSGEALVRWRHPTLGLLTPERFIGLAENTGLIIPLGQWVLDEACRQAAQWPDDIGIAVNLSARQLDHPTLLEDVAHTLAATGIRPARLVLEVTESVVVRDMDTTVRRLADLRGLGVRVAIDDFGTGYSSLSSLLELPVDVLKIDGSFVATMLERSEATSLVRLVVEMGHLLGLDVVAEGIEDEDQARALQRNQCQLGQGFLYSRPVDAATFAGFIEAPTSAPTGSVLEDAAG